MSNEDITKQLIYSQQNSKELKKIKEVLADKLPSEEQIMENIFTSSKNISTKTTGSISGWFSEKIFNNIFDFIAGPPSIQKSLFKYTVGKVIKSKVKNTTQNKLEKAIQLPKDIETFKKNIEENNLKYNKEAISKYKKIEDITKFQSLFNKAKLYIQKNQKADITVPTAQELLNVSNSAAVQQVINQNNAVQVIEHIPAPVVQSGGASFFSGLVDLLGFVGGIASGFSGGNSPSFPGSPTGTTPSLPSEPIVSLETSLWIEKPLRSHHTGGKVMGRGDVLAILKGGETVRTEAQEKELQEQLLKKHLESYAPLVSGQGDEQQNQQNGAFSSYSEKKSAKPVLQDRTRHDEEMIISIVADAWKTNRAGFRRILKSC